MGEIIALRPRYNRIDVNVLKGSAAQRSVAGLVAPARETVASTALVSHAAEPIKRVEDIEAICEYLLKNERYRDYMLFVVGINFGLRASDLRLLRFSDLINDDCSFKDSFAVFEQKTRNTRKVKKNRYITINDAVAEAVTIYLEHTNNVSLSDYMFVSISTNSTHEPISTYSIERIMKQIGRELHLDVKMSTHTLRKTFCYHQMLMSHNDPRKLLLLQKMLGHSTMAQTLAYIGITDEEIGEAYRELNLGSKTCCYFRNNVIYEREVV